MDFDALCQLAATDTEAFKKLPAHDLIRAARAHLQTQWRSIQARHHAGESGSNVVRLLTEAADEVVKGVVEFGIARAEHPRAMENKIAICALGGYGRGEMNPRSDLDICLLYDRKLSAPIKALNEFLLPSLWDLGFQTGYTLHSIRNAVDLARRDPEVYTTYAQARLLIGNPKIFAALRERMASIRPKEKQRILDYIKRRENGANLNPAYQELYATEPNIKEAVGGLRDFHTAFWVLLMTQGPMVIDDLERLGYLSDEDYLDFIKAIDFLWRVRSELHFRTAKKEDQLTFPLQKQLAIAFGYGKNSIKAIELFMQDYYLAAQRVRWFLQTAILIADEDPQRDYTDRGAPGRARITVYQGRLCFGNLDGKWFTESPARLMEVFWECSRRRVPLSYSAFTWIRDNLHLVEDAFRSSDVVRRYFVAICSRPLSAGKALREAARVGLLGAYLPEFAAIEGIIRYEDFHSYPVGEHTLRALEALGAIEAEKGSVERLLEKVLEHVRDPHILVMAILFHDLGKAAGDIHAEEGVRLAEQICHRIGMNTEETERIVFLVRHHMLMTNISFYRDLDDVDIVTSFAQTMKSDERLRELLLLTYADLAAVGPNVWNDWKGALLLKLYLKAERILSGRAQVAEEQYWKLPKADAVHAIASEYTRPQLDAYLKGLGERYFIAFSPQHIAQHMRCLAEAHSLGLSMHCEANRETGMSEVVVCTRDRKALFAAITGSFAANLVDVEGAAPFTTHDGYAIDCFTVKNAANGQPLSKSHFQAIKNTLEAVLLQEKPIQHFIERSRRRLFALLQPRVASPTRIFFDNSSSTTDTVIDIETGDRTGLLYDIGNALAEMGVEIISARIVTDARWVRDSFYVRKDNQKIKGKAVQTAIKDGLRQAIKPMKSADNKGVIA